MECVCGARAWKNAKKTMLVSESQDEHDIWNSGKTILGGEEQSADAETVSNTKMTGEAQDNGRQGN